MPDELLILSALLKLKLNTLNIYAIVGMTWWVSSVAFCGTIIGGAWLKRAEFRQFKFLKPLGFLLGFFFSSIVFFGIWMIIGIQQLRYEVDAIQAALKIPDNLSGNFEFTCIQVGYGVGTTSFAIILYVWFVLWRTISKGPPNQ